MSHPDLARRRPKMKSCGLARQAWSLAPTRTLELIPGLKTSEVLGQASRPASPAVPRSSSAAEIPVGGRATGSRVLAQNLPPPARSCGVRWQSAAATPLWLPAERSLAPAQAGVVKNLIRMKHLKSLGNLPIRFGQQDSPEERAAWANQPLVRHRRQKLCGARQVELCQH